MLKQILATSALLALVAVAAEPASAAGKFRQLVIEPTGAAEPVTLQKKKFASLVAQPANGIQTPVETADAGNGNGNGGGNKGARFIIAPSQGIPTPADTGSKGKLKQDFPTLAKVSEGIATPVKFTNADAGRIATAGSKAFPLIDSAPAGLTTPADVTADAPAVDSQPAKQVASIGSAGADQFAADDTETAPVVASTPATPAIAAEGRQDLYTLLTGRGYGVEILKRDAYGNMVFYVTVPGNTKEADLLVVDSTYTKVLQRKHITAYGYDRPAPYAPRYTTAYAGDDNCDQTAGY